jgi:hypothetical protein
MLPAGDHELTIARSGGGGGDVSMPFTCEVGYHSEQPASDADAKVALTTALVAAEVDEGRTFALEVAVANRTAEGLPMTLAVVGLPAGCDVPTNVLDDRRRAGDFDLWELRGRELILYWRGLAPHAERSVDLDCVARIPGVTAGPASRAYLYYTPSEVRWAPALKVDLTAATSPAVTPRRSISAVMPR